MVSQNVNELKNIVKDFGKTRAIDNINLEIRNGEFLTLLGPSGCGKTTMLRIIAGLENVTSGNVFLNGKNITSDSPSKRDISIMFQDYALCPHMTINENVAYGLRMSGIRKKERDKMANQWLEVCNYRSFQNDYHQNYLEAKAASCTCKGFNNKSKNFTIG